MRPGRPRRHRRLRPVLSRRPRRHEGLGASRLPAFLSSRKCQECPHGDSACPAPHTPPQPIIGRVLKLWGFLGVPRELPGNQKGAGLAAALVERTNKADGPWMDYPPVLIYPEGARETPPLHGSLSHLRHLSLCRRVQPRAARVCGSPRTFLTHRPARLLLGAAKRRDVHHWEGPAALQVRRVRPGQARAARDDQVRRAERDELRLGHAAAQLRAAVEAHAARPGAPLPHRRRVREAHRGEPQRPTSGGRSRRARAATSALQREGMRCRGAAPALPGRTEGNKVSAKNLKPVLRARRRRR